MAPVRATRAYVLRWRREGSKALRAYRRAIGVDDSYPYRSLITECLTCILHEAHALGFSAKDLNEAALAFFNRALADCDEAVKAEAAKKQGVK